MKRDSNEEKCWYDDQCVTNRDLCEDCKYHPKYKNVPIWSHFQAYIPVCPLGYKDCVNDPAYIKCYAPDWYKELYGNLTPKEASEKDCYPNEGCRYDDEDK